MLARSEYPIKVLSLIEKLIIMELGASPCQNWCGRLVPSQGADFATMGSVTQERLSFLKQAEARFGGPGRQARRAFRLQVKKQFRSLYMYVRACIL